MKTCPTCGARSEEPLDRCQRNVFVWTAMTVMIWAIVLSMPESIGEWALGWWKARPHVLAAFAGVPGVAIYWWFALIVEKRGEKRGGRP